MTTTITRCECGETQPHAPARYIAPGADGIDSTTRTCPGVVSEGPDNIGGMTTATSSPDDLQTYITITDAASELGMTPYALRNLVKSGDLDGELHTIRYGRAILLRECDVEALATPVEGPSAPAAVTEGSDRDWRDVTLPSFGLLQIEAPDGEQNPTACLGHNDLEQLDDLTAEQLRQLAVDAQAAADWLTPMSEGSARTLGAIADAADITLNELVDELGIDWDTATEADARRISRSIGERLSA